MLHTTSWVSRSYGVSPEEIVELGVRKVIGAVWCKKREIQIGGGKEGSLLRFTVEAEKTDQTTSMETSQKKGGEEDSVIHDLGLQVVCFNVRDLGK